MKLEMAIGLCHNEAMGKIYKSTCKYCNNQYKGMGKIYCSNLCKNRDRAGSPDFILKLSIAQKKRWTPELRKWRSDFNKEHNIKPPGFQKGVPLGRDISGKNNPNWQGGITPIHTIIRSSRQYKLWRKKVYERDNYTCVICEVPGNGKNLNADHIKAFSSHPELRLEVSNGRTLCVDCHRKTPNYGRPGKKQ